MLGSVLGLWLELGDHEEMHVHETYNNETISSGNRYYTIW